MISNDKCILCNSHDVASQAVVRRHPLRQGVGEVGGGRTAPAASRALPARREGRALNRRVPGATRTHTAKYTYDTFMLHSSWELAIASLACVQGFYRNRYAAFVHLDTNMYGESWALMRMHALLSWAEKHGLEVAHTIIPQIFVALCAEPNCTVWTGFLQHLLHATSALATNTRHAGLRRPEGWAPSRSAGEVFALQARGTKPYGHDGVKHYVWFEDGRRENALSPGVGSTGEAGRAARVAKVNDSAA